MACAIISLLRLGTRRQSVSRRSGFAPVIRRGLPVPFFVLRWVSMTLAEENKHTEIPESVLTMREIFVVGAIVWCGAFSQFVTAQSPLISFDRFLLEMKP